MNGTCQCGGVIYDRCHEVTTEKGALSHGFSVFPIEIEVSECRACGRAMLRAYKDGALIDRDDAERFTMAEIRAKIDADKVQSSRSEQIRQANFTEETQGRAFAENVWAKVKAAGGVKSE